MTAKPRGCTTIRPKQIIQTYFYQTPDMTVTNYSLYELISILITMVCRLVSDTKVRITRGKIIQDSNRCAIRVWKTPYTYILIPHCITLEHLRRSFVPNLQAGQWAFLVFAFLKIPNSKKMTCFTLNLSEL